MPTGAGNGQNPNSANASIKKGTVKAHPLGESLNVEPQIMCQEMDPQESPHPTKPM